MLTRQFVSIHRIGSRALKTLSRGPGPELTHSSDAQGIPTRPVWSVNKLLSSYPTPQLSSSTLRHLHDLAALIPPEEGTREHGKLKKELEEMIRLVEAVKLVDTTGARKSKWGPRLKVEDDDPSSVDEVSGHPLLQHASRTVDGFYIVESDRRH
ncbi:hypothetical protein K435DRAFT_773862 [Dendrothele bispora CBS 962.96]|uniref:Glutamyl-tRNA amidotransferase complex subunit Gta3 domain-containing protein n=1 Tax=Dendrothele bispora (strain CBS 962.96) TaxID=1314807 RepID=A0A4S8MQV2_DENBC|nr:hypothetical protein K435DRAFT_773862 [Dendrothele bispora CBS 962.96]